MSAKKTRMDGAFPPKMLPSHPFASTTEPVVEHPVPHVDEPEPVPSEEAPKVGGHIRISELGPTPYKAGGRRPAPDLDDSQPVRLTAYLTQDQVKALRAEVHRRQAKGKRADLSMLLREAVAAYLAAK
jgi:hypothetical protein